jgi:hypothetical protein
MIRVRPSQSAVTALLEAEGLPVSDLTEAHLEHCFFAGSDGAPSAIVSAFMMKRFLNPTGEL